MTAMSLCTNTTLLLPHPIQTLLPRKSRTMILPRRSVRRLGPVGKPVWAVHVGSTTGLANLLSGALTTAVGLGGAEVRVGVAGVLLQDGKEGGRERKGGSQ